MERRVPFAAIIDLRGKAHLTDPEGRRAIDAVALSTLPGGPKAFPQARTRDHILRDGHREQFCARLRRADDQRLGIDSRRRGGLELLGLETRRIVASNPFIC
jgi:hypothetical protein